MLDIILNLIKTEFSVAEGTILLKPLLLFIGGMVIYSIFIFKFYRFLARKNIFALNLNQYNYAQHSLLKKTLSIIFYIIEYILIFPIFMFFWFIVISSLIILLSKTNAINNILLMSMAIVATVRITAYYNEDLSKDLAKVLPFTLLVIFLFDISYFSPSKAIEIIKQIPTMWKTISYYLVFAICLELVLRIGSGILATFTTKKNSSEQQ